MIVFSALTLKGARAGRTRHINAARNNPYLNDSARAYHVTLARKYNGRVVRLLQRATRIEAAAAELHGRVLRGELVTQTVGGADCSLWLQGGEFVMSRQYGNSNPRHQLCVGATPPARLFAHWTNFCNA